MTNKIIEDAIANMAATSEALEAYCNDPKNFNSFSSTLIEQLSWELHRKANELREIQYMYGT